MLVSVTERTREIGLRMAVGARRFDILTQFLIEALTLSIAGGIIGVAAGLLTAKQLASQFNWPLLIRPQIMMIAVGFSAVVGIGFGLYPARKASRLDPIEALRFE
jgi:putative ABC transport system permease protein